MKKIETFLFEVEPTTRPVRMPDGTQIGEIIEIRATVVVNGKSINYFDHIRRDDFQSTFDVLLEQLRRQMTRHLQEIPE